MTWEVDLHKLGFDTTLFHPKVTDITLDSGMRQKSREVVVSAFDQALQP